MEVGLGIWTYTTLSHAARRGVRFAMIHGSNNPVLDASSQDITDSAVEAVVKANAIGLDPAQIAVPPPTWSPDRSRGSTVAVTVTYPFGLITGGLLFEQSTLQLSSTARMVVAN